MKIDYKKLKECLENEINSSNKVIICTHKNPDLDAIASAIGLYSIVETMGKDAYIVIDYEDLNLDVMVRRVLEDIFIKFNICTNNELPPIDDKTLFLITDVNGQNRIYLSTQAINMIKNAIIIDHHAKNIDCIKTPTTFISEELSSASEAIGKLLYMFNIKLKDKDLYNYILAGIALDTNFLTRKVNPATISVENYLLKKGANLNFVKGMFNVSFQEDRIIQNLVDFSSFYSLRSAIIMNRANPNYNYLISQLAQAADYVIQFVDVAMAMGFISCDEVYISARSNGLINAGALMSKLGGGGNIESAGANIKTTDIMGLYDEVSNLFKPDSTTCYKYLKKP